MLKQLSLIAITAISLSACVVHIGHDNHENQSEHWKKRQKENRAYIANLSVKQKKEVVLNELGTPDFSEFFNKEGKSITVLFYRTQHKKSDGETSKDETTPLIFVDNQLNAWGTSAYNNLLASH